MSDFNLLLLGSEALALREIMTMVVSAEGAVSDSHTDDADGTNHCFVGRKLWLAWDRLEGRVHGFEDTEYDSISGGWAKFDLETYLSLASACWFVVGPVEVVFLPGNLAHRVVTLAPYIGAGSFYVSLPGFLRTVLRWSIHPPLDFDEDLVSELGIVAARKLRSLKSSTPALRQRWGVWHALRAANHWARTATKSERMLVRKGSSACDFLRACGLSHEA